MPKGKIRKLIKGAARDERRESRFTARIGKKDASGNWVTQVPGRSINWVWVRPDLGGQAKAVYNDGAPVKPDAPVIVEYNVTTGLPTIVSVNHAYADAYNTDPTIPFTSVPPALTSAGSGREEFMSTAMLLDGLVSPDTGLTVKINAFTQVYNGALVFYSGGTQDLTAYVPSTSGDWCYALVAYDLIAQAISVTASASVEASWELNDALIAALSITNKIPLCAVVLKNGQTGPSSFPDQFRDCRPWVTGNWIKLPVDVQYGGTGQSSLTAHALLIGNGTNPVNFLAPGATGNVPVSDGTDWISRALVAADTPQVLPLAGGTLTGPITLTPQAAPGSPTEGELYYDSTAHALTIRNNTGWVTLTADTGITQLTGDVLAGPGSGSQAATLATVNSGPGTYALATVTVNAKGLVTAASAAATTGSGSVVLASAPTLTSPVINTGVSGSAISTDGTFASTSDTILASQKAIKTYVDAVATGLSPKASVRLATAAALPSNTYNNGSSGIGATLTGSATGVLTVDGQTVALNDRLLIKDEATPANNGIYICTTAGAVGVAYVLTRATDADAGSEILGSYVFVETGTTNASAGFVNTNATAPTIGTTAITWTQFTGAGEINAGTGLSKSGNTLSVDSTVVTLTGSQTLTNKTLSTGNSISADIPNTATGYSQAASGTTAQQPGSPAAGMFRYNSSTGRWEFYSTAWKNHVRLDGDTMTGTLEIDVATTSSRALVVKTTDNITTNNLVEVQKSTGAVLAKITALGKLVFATSQLSNITAQLDDTGLVFSRNTDGSYTTGITTSQGASPSLSVVASNTIFIGPNNNASATRVSIDSTFGITSPVGFIGNTLASQNNSTLKITCDPAAGSSHDGFDFIVGNRTAQGTQIAMGWFYNTTATELMRLTTAGNLGIGIAPSTTLHAVTTNTDTAVVANAATFGHNTSGTPTTSYGTGIQIQAQTSASANRNIGRTRWLWTNATDSSGNLAMKAVESGYYNASGTLAEVDVFSWGVNGSGAPLWAVFGATPVVQQSTTGTTTGFTAGAGSAVDSLATFTGGIGSTAYNISDIVRALKNYGQLAA